MQHCCGLSRNRNPESPHEIAPPFNPEAPKTKPKEDILFRIPGSTAHLTEDGEAIELARGDFTLILLTEENIVLATIVRIGTDLQWPLTKDEPVVKLDDLHYLFSLPSEGGEVLSYGVSFAEPSSSLASLDSFLKENTCFSVPSTLNSTAFSSSVASASRGLYWREYAPRIEDYNGILAKAIAGGTGELVRGIFKCTNAYVKQIQKGGEMIRSGAEGGKNVTPTVDSSNMSKSKGGQKKSRAQKGLKRVRKLSKMTEKISESLLNGVISVSGSVTAPLVRSQAGKKFLAMVPGEVLLASLDALSKAMDALEAAEKEVYGATSGAATRMVSQRYGESAGEVAEDVLATAGHAAGTAWNIFKIRKAINPKSTVTAAVVKNAKKNKQ